jgi:adenylylsulfate kinase
MRQINEKILNQRAYAIWLCGLSCAGKTSIANALEKKLAEKKFITANLDGDILRKGLNNNLSFSITDRYENLRRVAEVNKLFIQSGLITINAFISPTIEMRNMIREIIGKDNFILVYVNAPIDICEQRDVKGLYKKARNGEILDFTGVNSPFEEPVDFDIELNTGIERIEESVKKLVEFVLPRVRI